MSIHFGVRRARKWMYDKLVELSLFKMAREWISCKNNKIDVKELVENMEVYIYDESAHFVSII